jgi:hypothetical protein
MCSRPVINAGVFAAKADSNLWKEWPELLWKTIGNQGGFHMTDQNTQNYLIYENNISSLILPAEYNWLILFSRPAVETGNEKLFTPVPPHSLIKILHLAGLKDRHKSAIDIVGKDGKNKRIPFLYKS